MGFWLIEDHTAGYSVKWQITKIIHTEQTPYQHLAIVETVEFGRALVLDGIVQTTVADEFIYHEMLVHVPMFTHPDPRRILIIGGGDGGTAREALKHQCVEQVDMVEIDARVVDACRAYLPELSCALSDPRLNLIIDDGVRYIQSQKDKYDVVIIDSSDPIGPAVELFGKEFYENVYRALKGDGLFVSHAESPFFYRDVFQRVYKNIKSTFPLARVYLTCVPSYISGFWSFTLGSKQYHPVKDYRKYQLTDMKYYSPEIHQASFVLPVFLSKMLEE